MTSRRIGTSGGKLSRLGAAAAAIVVLVVLVAGCGGDSTGTTSVPATGTTIGGVTTTAGDGVTTSSPNGSTIQVVLRNTSYNPETVTVKAGDTVEWINEDPLRHDVVAENGEFESELFGQGETFSFTFSAPGTYPYFCSIHAGMEGTVVVE